MAARAWRARRVKGWIRRLMDGGTFIFPGPKRRQLLRNGGKP